jgi:hypothetical protein
MTKKHKPLIGDQRMISAATFTILEYWATGEGSRDDGSDVFVSTRCYYWVIVPDGMTRQEAPDTQTHYGPFDSEADAIKNQNVVLLGEACKVTDGGTWDPAWDTLQ